MARTIPVSSVQVSPVPEVDGAFIVEALRISDHAWWFHEGPVLVCYFTEDQARALAARVRRTGMIDPDFWSPVSRSWGEVEEDWNLHAHHERMGYAA